MKNQIPFFDYSWMFEKHRDSILKIVSAVSERGAFIMQDDLLEFEQNLANYVNAKHAIGVGNATDALQILMMAGGLKVNDEVLFCSHTMVATASAIHFAGAKPVPVDTGFDHLIDVESIKQSITSNTKAICPTQLNGRIADMEAILEIADQYDFQIYEDAAQALGAKYNNQHAGTFGLGGCISFYPAKILGCFGDGGAVICNDDDIAYKIKLMRDHGRDASGNIPLWGFNSRLDNLQAALLNYFFHDYPSTIARRREIAEIYHTNLSHLSNIKLPEPPSENKKNFDVFQNYEIQAEKRDELKEFLANKGIGTLIQWGGTPVHQFRDLGFTQELKNTALLFAKLLMLPMNMSIEDKDIHFICEQISDFYP